MSIALLGKCCAQRSIIRQVNTYLLVLPGSCYSSSLQQCARVITNSKYEGSSTPVFFKNWSFFRVKILPRRKHEIIFTSILIMNDYEPLKIDLTDTTFPARRVQRFSNFSVETSTLNHVCPPYCTDAYLFSFRNDECNLNLGKEFYFFYCINVTIPS